MSEVFGQALRRQKNGQEHVKSVSLHSNFPSPSGTTLAEKPGTRPTSVTKAIRPSIWKQRCAPANAFLGKGLENSMIQ